MGWQDRDYARRDVYHGHMGHPARPPILRGRSIVTILIIVNVAIYVLGALSPDLQDLTLGVGAMQARAVLHGQVWRLITAQYLHASTWHLLFNMIGLHFLGRPIEQMWSTRKFLTIYTLCGLFGNLFYTFLGWRGVLSPLTPAVGASGCILGLLGVLAVRFPNATVFIFPIPFPLKIRSVALILGGIAVLAIIERSRNYGGEACHLAGLVFGVWWAWKGERWWASSSWGFPRRRAPRRTQVRRAPQPRGFANKIAERREDAETIDRILKKVYDGGIHSLTEAEKRALQEATERQRQRDQEAGRVDRL